MEVYEKYLNIFENCIKEININFYDSIKKII